MSHQMVIFTDPGEEIDDEIALWKLDSLAFSNAAMSKYIINVVAVGGNMEPSRRIARCKDILGSFKFLKFFTPDDFDSSLMKDSVVLIIGPLELSDNSEKIISQEFPPKLVVLAGSATSSVNWGKTPAAQQNCKNLLDLAQNSVIIDSATLSLQKMTPEFLSQLPNTMLPRVAALTWRFLLGRARGHARYVAHLISPSLAAVKKRPASNYVAVESVCNQGVLKDITVSDQAKELAEKYAFECLEGFVEYCETVNVGSDLVLTEYSQVMEALLKLGWYECNFSLSDDRTLQDEVLLSGCCEKFNKFQKDVFKEVGSPLPCYDHTALCTFLELVLNQ